MCVRASFYVVIHGIFSYNVGDGFTMKNEIIFIQFQLLIFPFPFRSHFFVFFGFCYCYR